MTDLEWLARNVDLKLIKNDVYVSKYEDPNLPSVAYYGSKEFIPSKAVTVTKVLAERERLINRPKFESAPEWAMFLAQDADGKWVWYKNQPSKPVEEDWGAELRSGYETACVGEVIGDWKGSLMVRPEVVIDPVVAANTEAFNSVDFAMNLIGANAMKEWNGEGLPPVGTICHVDTDFHSVDVEIKLYDGDSVVYRPKVDSLYSERIADCKFSPIRTEEDKAIEELAVFVHTCNIHMLDDKQIAKALYAAGYKKHPANN